MRHFGKLTMLLALAIGALALGACGDEEDGTGAGSEAAPAADSPIAIDDVDGTDVLVDGDGRTLYTADVEEGSEILCVDACTSFWAPVGGSDADAQAAEDALGADVGVVERPDGDRQLALDGAPLYSFTEEGPGELTGDGFVDDFQGTTFTWSVAAAAGAAPASDSGAGDSSPGY